MMEMVGLSFAVVAGVEARRVMLLAGALYFPVAVLAAAGLAIIARRSHTGHRPALLCEAVASELRAGASLRDALLAAAETVGIGDGLVPGMTVGEVIDLVSERLGDLGPEIRLGMLGAARTGARSADLFDEMASLAIARAEIAHEIRIASAPARVTGMIFLGAPASYLAFQTASGRLDDLIALPGQRMIVVASLGLIALGMLAGLVVLRRAH